MASIRNPKLFDINPDVSSPDNNDYNEPKDRVFLSVDNNGVLTEISREYSDGTTTTEIFSYNDISDSYDYEPRYHITSDVYGNDGNLIEHRDFGTDYSKFDSSDINQSPDTYVKYEDNGIGTTEYHYDGRSDDIKEIRAYKGDDVSIEKFKNGESQGVENYKEIDGQRLMLVESTPSGDSTVERWQPSEISNSAVLVLEREPSGAETYVSYTAVEEHNTGYESDNGKDVIYKDIEIKTEIKYDEHGEVSEKIVTTTKSEEYMDAGGTEYVESTTVEIYDKDDNLVKYIEDSDRQYKGDYETFERDKTHIEKTINEDGTDIEDKTETHFAMDENEFEKPVTKDEVVYTRTETDIQGETRSIERKFVGSENGEYSNEREHRLVSETVYETAYDGELKETFVTEYGSPDSDGDLTAKSYEINEDGKRELVSKEIVNEKDLFNPDKEKDPEKDGEPDKDVDPYDDRDPYIRDPDDYRESDYDRDPYIRDPDDYRESDYDRDHKESDYDRDHKESDYDRDHKDFDYDKESEYNKESDYDRDSDDDKVDYDKKFDYDKESEYYKEFDFFKDLYDYRESDYDIGIGPDDDRESDDKKDNEPEKDGEPDRDKEPDNDREPADEKDTEPERDGEPDRDKEPDNDKEPADEKDNEPEKDGEPDRDIDPDDDKDKDRDTEDDDKKEEPHDTSNDKDVKPDGDKEPADEKDNEPEKDGEQDRDVKSDNYEESVDFNDDDKEISNRDEDNDIEVVPDWAKDPVDEDNTDKETEQHIDIDSETEITPDWATDVETNGDFEPSFDDYDSDDYDFDSSDYDYDSSDYDCDTEEYQDDNDKNDRDNDFNSFNDFDYDDDYSDF